MTSLCDHSNALPAVGSVWRNKHTGDETTVVKVGPAPMFDQQIRVLTDSDMTGGAGTNNGWMPDAFRLYWEQLR